MAEIEKRNNQHIDLIKTKDGDNTYLMPKNNLDGISVDTDYTGLDNESTLSVFLPTIENDGDDSEIARSPFGIYNLDGVDVSEDLFNKVIQNKSGFIGAPSTTDDPVQLPFNIYVLNDTISLDEAVVDRIMGNT